jgi:hypothetical protein
MWASNRGAGNAGSHAKEEPVTTATATAPAFSPETRDQIKRLERATAARARNAEQVTRFTVRATMAHTEQARIDWTELRDLARQNRDGWDAVIRDLRRALRD